MKVHRYKGKIWKGFGYSNCYDVKELSLGLIDLTWYYGKQYKGIKLMAWCPYFAVEIWR